MNRSERGHVMRTLYATLSAAAVADALTTPTGVASASGTAGSSTVGSQTPRDNRVHHLAGGTPGESAAHSSKTG